MSRVSELDVGSGRSFIPVRTGVDDSADGERASGPIGVGGSVKSDGNARSSALYRAKVRLVSGIFGISGFLVTAGVIVQQIWGR